MGFKHRGIDIHVREDGKFTARLEDETVVADTLQKCKDALTRKINRGRKFDVPAQFWLVEDWPHAATHLDVNEIKLHLERGRYTGVNLHQQVAKLHTDDGDEIGAGHWGYDRVWGFPIGQDETEREQRLFSLLKRYREVVTELHEFEEELDGYALHHVPNDHARATEWEREKAATLKGDAE